MQAHSGQRNQALVDQGSGHLIFHGFLLFPDPLCHSLSLSAGITPHTAAAKSCQSCPTLCDPIDGSPTDSSVPGILQARTLEWVAISFSNAWKWKNEVKSFSHAWLFTTPMECSPPDSSVHGILQARTLEWDAIAFSNLSHYSHSVHVPLPKIVIGTLFSVFSASLNFTQYLISYKMNSWEHVQVKYV